MLVSDSSVSTFRDRASLPTPRSLGTLSDVVFQARLKTYQPDKLDAGERIIFLEARLEYGEGSKRAVSFAKTHVAPFGLELTT